MPGITPSPNVMPIYNLTAEIDTTPTGESATYVPFGAGFNNFTEALNEVLLQYFFLNDGGFARNYTSGMAPVITLTGVRVIGDPAQEYIFGNKFKLMANRETQIQLTREDAGGTTTTVVTCNVNIQNIQEYGGATTDGAAVSVELAFNGTPQVTQGSTAAASVQSVQESEENVGA